MNRDEMGKLDEYRRNEAGPLENDLVDELAGGWMDREEFIRRASVLGLSMGVIGSALGAYGTPDELFTVHPAVCELVHQIVLQRPGLVAAVLVELCHLLAIHETPPHSF